MKRKLYKWIKIILIAYGSIGIAFYYLQDYFLFRSIPLEKSFTYHFSDPYTEVNVRFDSISNINIIRFSTSFIPKGVVLYFHGNKMNTARYEKFSYNFTKNGYEVWMIDYPGYGKSTGPL